MCTARGNNKALSKDLTRLFNANVRKAKRDAALPVSRRANITLRQAIAAVRAYLKDKA